METWKSEGPSSVLKKVFFLNKEIIPAEKDLALLPSLKQSPKMADITFVEISPDTFNGLRSTYASKNRHLRVSKNFNKGYRGFAIIKGEEIVGDIWYCTTEGTARKFRHPDLEWLEWVGIQIGEKDVYLFEMYVKTGERGGGLVNFMLWNALNALKEKGYKRAYGYCTADNIPALWVHRTLGYKELERIKMHRVLSATRRSIKGENPRKLYRIFDLS
jgi:GNAT superfamily N-acetyltransferase